MVCHWTFLQSQQNQIWCWLLRWVPDYIYRKRYGEYFVDVCLLALCANNIHSIMYSQSRVFSYRIFTKELSIAWFWHSHELLDWQWHNEVMCCSFPVKLWRELLCSFPNTWSSHLCSDYSRFFCYRFCLQSNCK